MTEYRIYWIAKHNADNTTSGVTKVWAFSPAMARQFAYADAHRIYGVAGAVVDIVNVKEIE